MKKIIITILTVLLTLSLAACNDKEAQISSEDEESSFSEIAVDEEFIEIADSEEFTEIADSGDSIVIEGYAIGDIILADGSVVEEENLTEVDEANPPMAVIAGFRDDSRAFGVGVHRSDSTLQWAADSTEDAAEIYPAFNFIDTYAESYNLTGDYAFGWYMPSIEELCDIYQNREAVNTSLKKIYGLDNNAAMDGLHTNWYWSSSQSDSADDYAWFVHYYNGYAGECPKDFTNVHVIAVRIF